VPKAWGAPGGPAIGDRELWFCTARDTRTALGKPILAAWNVKEDLMDLLSRHGTQPDRVKIYDLLVKF
jgi:hypothetical protein